LVHLSLGYYFGRLTGAVHDAPLNIVKVGDALKNKARPAQVEAVEEYTLRCITMYTLRFDDDGTPVHFDSRNVAWNEIELPTQIKGVEWPDLATVSTISNLRPFLSASTSSSPPLAYAPPGSG